MCVSVCVCVRVRERGVGGNLHQRWSRLHWMAFKREWANRVHETFQVEEKRKHPEGEEHAANCLHVQHVQIRSFCTFAFIFGNISLTLSETEKAKRKGTKTTVWHLSECNCRCFQKDTEIILADTQSTMQSRADSSGATWEKSSPRRNIWRE